MAYSTDTDLYVSSLVTGKTVHIGPLPGLNIEPSWLQGSRKPCLLFVNGQTAADTIYLACLMPQPAWAPVTQGDYPVWLGP